MVINLRTKEETSYGTRRGDYAREPYTTEPGRGGLHINYEKNQYDGNYPGDNRTSTSCGFTEPQDPGYNLIQENCASFACRTWNKTFPKDSLSAGPVTDIPNPGALSQSIGEKNNPPLF